MARLMLALVVLAVACSSKTEPPPDPLGACGKAAVVFDKVKDGLTYVFRRGDALKPDAYCAQLQSAVKAGSTVALGLLATGGNDDSARAKAARAVRDATTALLAGVGAAADKCNEHGVAATQAVLEAQLAKSRTAVEKACSK